MTLWIIIAIVVIVAASALWGLWGLVRAELARRAVEEALLKNQLANLTRLARATMREESERKTLH